MKIRIPHARLENTYTPVRRRFGGSLPIAQAYIADVTTREERPRFLAILGSVMALAFMVGPGIGAGLAEFSMSTPMFASAGLGLFGLVLAFFLFHDYKPLSEGEGEDGEGEEEGEEEGEAGKKKKEQKQKKQATTNGGVSDGGRDIEMGTMSKTGAGGSKDKKEDGKGQGAGEKEEESAESESAFKKYTPLIRLMWLVAFLNMFTYAAILASLGIFIKDVFEFTSLHLGEG